VNDNPNVVAPPPLIALAAIVIGFVLEYVWPMPLPEREARLFIGIATFALGFALFAWALATFRSAGTSVETRKPSTTVVVAGPYRLTRNPIYLGMALGIVGVGIAAGSVWVFAMTLPFLAVIDHGVISHEERYLEAKFGAPYRAYRERVRRWV
jgi:protein-S-isoprenylcysteine O-methyltransferase Ste14